MISLPRSVWVVQLVLPLDLLLIAAMKFRPKRKKSNQTEVYPGFEDPSDDDSEEEELTNESFPNHIQCEAPRAKHHSRDILRINLQHGDILIQQGVGLQQLYEVLSLLVCITEACGCAEWDTNRCYGTVYRCCRAESWTEGQYYA